MHNNIYIGIREDESTVTVIAPNTETAVNLLDKANKTVVEIRLVGKDHRASAAGIVE